MLYYSKNFLTFTGKHLSEIFKNAYFEEHLCTAASKLALRSDCWNFVSRLHLKRSRLNNITKIPVALNKTKKFQSFKQNWAHMLSTYLRPMLSCEPSCRMFIINCSYTKSKRL